MNTEFSRIITLLRKERKLSQKQAAEELGISQSLLSHYEKGIRECGLDFIIKAADYYHVSCDYLLGRTAERSFEDADIPSAPGVSRGTAGGVSRRLADSSISIIYDLLDQVNNRRLTRGVTTYLMLCIYKIFRCLYESNPDNPEELFTVPRTVCGGYTNAVREKLFTDIEAMGVRGSESYVPSLSKLKLSAESLARDYPGDAAALFNVIRQSENSIKSIGR